MKIIYRQTDKDGIFGDIGVENLMIKHIFCEADKGYVSLKEHHHRSFEIHIVKKGCQTYGSDGKIYEVKEGSAIAFFPQTKHIALSHFDDTQKISVTFLCDRDGENVNFLPKNPGTKIFEVPKRLLDVLDFLLEETKSTFAYCEALQMTLAFEAAVLLKRCLGAKKTFVTGCAAPADTDARVMMAKDYISDNIELDINVEDVASYCYMGTRQLARLFGDFEGVSPGAYIRRERIIHIEKLLGEDLTLSQISRKMNFSSEYHFNSFFKKYAGMPPGEYRKMNRVK